MGQFNQNEAEKEYPPMHVKPVGVVRTDTKEVKTKGSQNYSRWKERAAELTEERCRVSTLVIDDRLEGILDGIEEFSHLMVIYWAHLIPEESCRVTKVHPMGSKDLPLTGIFATHSPVRPNKILVSIVRLLKREVNILRVMGLDALDGSPVLDIKPYLPAEPDSGEVRVPGWVKEMRKYLGSDMKPEVG